MPAAGPYPPASLGVSSEASPPSLEALLAEVVVRVREARGADVMDGVLSPIARFFGAEQAYLALRLPDGSGWDQGHVWTALGAATGTARRRMDDPRGAAWTDHRLLAGHAVLANSLDELPPDAAEERARYAALGLRSVLDVPLRGSRGEVVACAGLRTLGRAASWDAGDVARLQLAGDVAVGMMSGQGAGPADEAEMRRMAALLRRVEERLYVALDAARMGVFDWDVASDRVWYVSPFPGQQHYPRDTHETTTGQWFQSTHPDDMTPARDAVARAVLGERDDFTTTVRMQIRARGEGWSWIRSRGHVLERGPDRRALRVIGIYQDVSDEVRRDAHEREREAAFAHATRSAALGTLATSLAHELNQPLAALTGFVQAAARLLERGEGTRDEVTGALRRSAELAEKASEIVRRLRRLVQHSPPLLEEVDVHAVMRSVADLLARDARAAHVELRVEPGPAGLHLNGDRIQLEQVLVNLVRNAIEAFPPHGPEGRLVTLRAVRTAHHVELRVADSGPGVPRDVVGRLFEPFLSTKATGTGLGLTISRSIVEAHGGALRLEQAGPGGTCFLVTLPLSPDPHDDTA